MLTDEEHARELYQALRLAGERLAAARAAGLTVDFELDAVPSPVLGRLDVPHAYSVSLSVKRSQTIFATPGSFREANALRWRAKEMARVNALADEQTKAIQDTVAKLVADIKSSTTGNAQLLADIAGILARQDRPDAAVLAELKAIIAAAKETTDKLAALSKRVL